jgi:hypothetical protein
MDLIKFLWNLKDATATDWYHIWLRIATLVSMVFAAIGMFGFSRFFRYAYFLIALSIIMGVLLSASKA